MYNAPLSENGQKRLQSIRQSNDGFWLAEQDLLIRGAGDVFGTAQTGFKDFKIAQIPAHVDLLTLAHQLANQHPQPDKIIERWYSESQKFLQA
jgi:ATP-dependent DNA helicase RecG